MTDLAEQPMTKEVLLLVQLAYSPLYIITVILALGGLIFLKVKKLHNVHIIHSSNFVHIQLF